jgi:hypothetical protein
MSFAERARINSLAEREGVSVQRLARYAFDLALAAYGVPPLDKEAGADR